jgi:tRNA threonylcarbamoyladenosine biosynthesis protein TsaE
MIKHNSISNLCFSSGLTDFPTFGHFEDGYICMMELVFDLKHINEAAKKFWQGAGDKKVFAFHGSMGAGKTTFIHALCDDKKVSSPVGSPTFSIINEYSYPDGKIFHIDLYRLKDEEEAIRAGVEDSLYSGEICLVEWPEKAPGIFHEDTVHVYINLINANARRILAK